MSQRSWVWGCLGLLFALALGLYAKTWGFGYTRLDDNELVGASLQHLKQGKILLAAFSHRLFLNETNLYYRPLVNLSFAFNALLSGKSPWGYHFTNGVFHAVACTSLFLLLERLGMGLRVAFAAAVIFAVHPMHVAAVAWIPGRNDSLLGCFTFGSLLALAQGNLRWARYAHVLCFSAALLCKETALVLPAVYLPLLLWQTGEQQPSASNPRLPTKQRFTSLARWGLGWGLSVVVYFAVRSQVLSMPAGHVEKLLFAAWNHRAMFLSDLGKVLVPIHLQVIATANDIHPRLGLYATVPLVIGLGLGWRRLRPPIVLLGCSLLTLPLALSLLASDFLALESRLYLPVSGACVLCAEALRSVDFCPGRGRLLVMAPTALLALTFAWTTVSYSNQFADGQRFSAAAVKSSPRSYLAVWLLGQQAASRIRSGPPAKKP